MDDLRHGRLDITPHYFDVDLPFYKEYLKDFLPDKIIDIHVHSGDNPGIQSGDTKPKFWPEWVTFGHGMTVHELLDAYIKMFPGKEVFPVCFPNSSRSDFIQRNAYIAKELKNYKNIWGFLWTTPDWSKDELTEQMTSGGFKGIKPYINMVQGIPESDITIFDYLPEHHIQAAVENGWIIMLHIPRKDRLADPLNISHLKKISRDYPDIKLIVAHVGRAYCTRTGTLGIPPLKDCKNILFDFSANSNQQVMELLIQEVGPKRILFGSDMPITAMRAKRVCEGDEYINYIRHADWEDSRTRRNIDEEENYSFFLYEELMAFKKAAVVCNLRKSDIEDIFFNNAYNLLTQ